MNRASERKMAAICKDVVESIIGYIKIELDSKTLEELRRDITDIKQTSDNPCNPFLLKKSTIENL